MTEANASYEKRSLVSLFRCLRHEGTVWIAGLVVAFAGHAAASDVLELLLSFCVKNRAQETHASGYATIVWMGAFLAATVVFYTMYGNPHPSRLPRRSRAIVWYRGLVPWVAAMFAVVSFYGAAAAIHGYISSWNLAAFPPILFVTYCVALALSIAILARVRDQVLVVRTVKEQKKDFPRRSHLILFLADVKIESYRADDWHPPRDKVRWSDPPDLEADLEELVRAKKLQDDETERKKKIPFWPWEMSLRALRAHRGKLDQVILICSPQSIVQAASFGRRVRLYEEFGHVNVGVWAERGGSLSVSNTETTQNFGSAPSQVGSFVEQSDCG